MAAVAAERRESAARVLPRRALQHGIGVTSKSARSERIAQNADRYDFALDAADVQRLDRRDEGHRTGRDPTRLR